MKLPKGIKENLVLKITSLNAVVISIRLVISFFIQGSISRLFGEVGHAVIGQVRSLLPMVSSISTFGSFSGIVKYVAANKDNKPELVKLFSTVFAFCVIGTIIAFVTLFFGANYISIKIFNTETYNFVIKILAFTVPFIAMNRVFYGIVNGVSDYKNYAKVDLFGYLLSVIFLALGLYYKDLTLVLITITVTPFIQLIVLLATFGKKLKTFLQPQKIAFNLIYKNQIVAFTIMSFVATFLVNYVEIDLRSYLIKELNINEAGYWTSVTNVSKNYMVFATGIFSLYVLPKFAAISTKKAFFSEVIHIYKTILPIFGLGMILVYLLRFIIIDFLYPGFEAMESLFKWQLIGDFIKLCSMIVAHQFIAKRMVKSFVITELISLVLFYRLSIWFIKDYGTQGIVMAHFVRYIIYFIVVIVFIKYYFNTKKLETLNA